MNKGKWLFYRWSLMSHPWEEFYRIVQILQKIVIDPILSVIFRNSLNIRLSTNYIPKYSISTLSKIVDTSSDAIFYLNIFNRRIDIRSIHEWNKDIKNNIVSESKFYFLIDKNDFNQVGELKYANELSRLLHLPSLASKIVIDNDLESLYLLKNQLKSWKIQNPFLRSFNWKDGIEVAIRIYNIILTDKILSLKANHIDNDLRKLINYFIFTHFIFLISHLSKFSSANNHLLAELFGIIIIATHYKFPLTDFWLRKAKTILLSEFDKQINKDGFNKEDSTCYHAASLFIFNSCFYYLNNLQLIEKDTYLNKLSLMVEVLENLRINENEFIEIGDNDDSKFILNTSQPTYHRYNSIINSVKHHLYNQSCSDLVEDLGSYLLLGDSINNANPIAENQKIDNYYYYKDSGYFIFIASKSKLIFSVGQFGLPPMYAHAHGDLLNFSLSFLNKPFIVDSGTYQYHHKYIKWRNYFRSSRAHNCIVFDDQDQGIMLSNMMWKNTRQAKVLEYGSSFEGIFCKASYTLNSNHKKKIIHYRFIQYNTEKLNYTISDEIDCSSDLKIDFYLHLHPDVKIVKSSETSFKLVNQYSIILTNSLFRESQIIKGNETIPLGWYSPSYDSKVPTNTIHFSTNTKYNRNIITEIKLR